MPEEQFKRNIAYKLRIGDILNGKSIMSEGKFKFLELGNKKIIRINLIGNIIDKYESSGEKKYIFFKIDDGSGQISIKVFGDDIEKFKNVFPGETILIIGRINNWNNETYITPEIIKQQNTKYLVIRKLEIEKQRSEEAPKEIELGKIIEFKDRIVKMIKDSEEDGGIETEKIIMNIRDISPEMINEKIQKMIEDGMIFEPRPGKVRYLG